MRLRPELARAGWIRSLILVSVAMLWTSAAGASDPDASIRGNYRGLCRRLTKQIEYYDKQIRPLAIARRDRTWEAATDAHLTRLWNRRADLCPEYGKERARILLAIDRIRAFNRMLARAGRAAAQYFSGGAVP